MLYSRVQTLLYRLATMHSITDRQTLSCQQSILLCAVHRERLSSKNDKTYHAVQSAENNSDHTPKESAKYKDH